MKNYEKYEKYEKLKKLYFFTGSAVIFPHRSSSKRWFSLKTSLFPLRMAKTAPTLKRSAYSN